MRLLWIALAACAGSPAVPVPPPPAPSPKPTSVVGAEKPAVELTPDTILGEIQASYMVGIKRCYKNHLKQDPEARGKVQLSFTVTETGAIADGKASGFAGTVDACVSAQMVTWRFPIPLDKTGVATQANFAITLQLIPD